MCPECMGEPAAPTLAELREAMASALVKCPGAANAIEAYVQAAIDAALPARAFDLNTIHGMTFWPVQT